MLNRFTLLISMILIGFFSVVLFFVVKTRKEEVLVYKNYLIEQKKITKEPLSSVIQQVRENVHKDIWYTQDDQTRLQYKIESPFSLLILSPSEGKIEVEEQLLDISCWMQEKIFEKEGELFQSVRFLQAKQGIYHYHQQKFQAENADISFFTYKGQELPLFCSDTPPFLRGRAKKIEISAEGKVPHFQAHEFQANLKEKD